MTERRQEPRISKVMEATWHALSGAARCRVTDISRQGCFVDAVVPAQVGDVAEVTINLGHETINLRGRIRYVEPRIGFGLHFDAITNAQSVALEPLLG